jgi:hypothetical protein
MSEHSPVPEKNKYKEELEQELLDAFSNGRELLYDQEVFNIYIKWTETAQAQCTTSIDNINLTIRQAELYVSGGALEDALDAAIEARNALFSDAEAQKNDAGFELVEIVNRLIDDINNKMK